MKIGITGARGVIGKLIIAQLKSKKIEFFPYEKDIRDSNSLTFWLENNKIDIIIHLASKVAVNEVNNNRIEAYDVNINGTINLLKAIENYNNNVFLFYASSSHVYKSKLTPIKETDELSPINTYGLTKKISEDILIDYKENSNLNLCIGRIFSFYHESQKPPFLYPTIKKRLEVEDLTKPFNLYGATSERDFLNAEKVSEIIIELCLNKIEGIYNIGSGKGTKIIDFVKSIAPENINIVYDKNEIPNKLVANINKLKKINEL